MYDDCRYNSGTSLHRTSKEECIDSLEQAMWAEFTDSHCQDLKKLNIETIRMLRRSVEERVNGAREQERKQGGKD